MTILKMMIRFRYTFIVILGMTFFLNGPLFHSFFGTCVAEVQESHDDDCHSTQEEEKSESCDCEGHACCQIMGALPQTKVKWIGFVRKEKFDFILSQVANGFPTSVFRPPRLA